jgi:hypothetical protein
MTTKQVIVTICLMAAGLLAEAGISFHETHKTSRSKFGLNNKANVPEALSDVDMPARDPDAFLTTVREFLFIMIRNEEIVAA